MAIVRLPAELWAGHARTCDRTPPYRTKERRGGVARANGRRDLDRLWRSNDPWSPSRRSGVSSDAARTCAPTSLPAEGWAR